MGRWRDRIDPDDPRNGKFSLNDIREHIGYHMQTYQILKEMGWQVPRLYMFTPEEAYQILAYRHAREGRRWLQGREFRKHLEPRDGRPLRKDPDDIFPPEPYLPEPKGFKLRGGRSMTRLKRPGLRKTPPSSK